MTIYALHYTLSFIAEYHVSTKTIILVPIPWGSTTCVSDRKSNQGSGGGQPQEAHPEAKIEQWIIFKWVFVLCSSLYANQSSFVWKNQQPHPPSNSTMTTFLQWPHWKLWNQARNHSNLSLLSSLSYIIQWVNKTLSLKTYIQ